mmetsp:Transcript_2301/g.10452  ORF Transcript_2301/g.10452 Transcript_2301/m.10452 type:complete len:258 (+) Transcript_2301:646-1419(+)
MQRRTGRTQLIDLLLHTQHIDSDEAIVMLATKIDQLPQCVIDGGGGVHVHSKRCFRAKIFRVFRAMLSFVDEPFEPIFDHTFPVFRRRLHLANSLHTFLHLCLTMLRQPTVEPSMVPRHTLFQFVFRYLFVISPDAAHQQLSKRHLRKARAFSAKSKLLMCAESLQQRASGVDVLVEHLSREPSPIKGCDYVLPQFLRPRHLFLRPLAALVVIEVGPVHLLMLTTAVIEPTAARAAHRRGIPADGAFEVTSQARRRR